MEHFFGEKTQRLALKLKFSFKKQTYNNLKTFLHRESNPGRLGESQES